jgi:nucleoside 2-deoxyribosyltransferase
MKIYFAGSIRGGRQDKELYLKLIKHLSKYGQVLTEHVGDQNLTEAGEDGPNDEFIYKRDINWIKEADIIIAEVSTPSLGVGYEISFAENLNKPILCLYRGEKPLSSMIAGNNKIKKIKYKDFEDAKTIIDNFFQN